MPNATAGPGPKASAAAAGAAKTAGKTLSAMDRQIWQKIKASKSSAMTQEQVIDSLAQNDGTRPALSIVQASIANLLRLKLLMSTKINGVTTFVWQSSASSDVQASNDQEMAMCLEHVRQSGPRGISAKQIRMRAGQDKITNVMLRRALDALVRTNQIKSFKTINNPTMPMYVLFGLEPSEDLVGGIWYKDSKEYDSPFVTNICKFLLTTVRKASYPSTSKRPEAKKLVANPIYANDKAARLPSPRSLADALNASKLTSVTLSVKNVMECMRALELDGLVEVVKPTGGLPDSDDEDYRPSKRSRDSSDDERERDKKEERARERAIERKRREKERKAEDKRQKKLKEAQKKAKKAAKKAKKMAKKEKKRKDKRKKKDSSSESDGSDSDALVDINDVDNGDASSKKKDKKRKRRSSDSDSDSDDSSSDSDSDSSDSDSDSDDSDDNISIDSYDIDDAEVEAKPSASRATGLEMAEVHGSAFGITDLTNLNDEQVLYRATNKYRLSLVSDQVPCGKCPRFHFCEEDGPVNPDGCTYFEDWFADVVGGWDGSGKQKYKPEMVKREQREREEELKRRQGGISHAMNGAGDDDEDDMDEDTKDKDTAGDIEDLR